MDVLDFGDNQTTLFLSASNGLFRPVDVAEDGADNLYVLNQGTGGNGSILEFDRFGNLVGTNAVGLAFPTALTLDGYGNIFVAESNGVVQSFSGSVSNTVATVSSAGVQLTGIALFDDGTIAVSDAGNQVIWQINAITKAVSRLTGQQGVAGSTLGNTNFAKFNLPGKLARAGGGLLVLADTGNNRLVTVGRDGSVTNLLNATNALVWFGEPGDPVGSGSTRFVSMLSPVAVAVGSGGTVYASETTYHDIRGLQNTGLSGPAPGPFDVLPYFSGPGGVALDSGGSHLFIADPADNAVDVLDFGDNQTTLFLSASNGLFRPVDVAEDGADNLYVLNQGTGGNGSILEFDRFGNLVGTNAVGLTMPTAMTLDAAGNILVAEQNGVVQSFSAGTSNTVATVAAAGVQLEGIALFSDGTIVVSDAGNDVLWQINPFTHAVSLFTGQIGSPGSTLGSPAFARLNQPRKIALAGAGSDDVLVAADSGNNRLVVIGRDGSVTNVLNSTNASVWFGEPGDPVGAGSSRFVPMLSPNGIAVYNGGTVYASETTYHDIRGLTGTGLSLPVTVNGGGPGTTNVVVTPPTITPNSGYYPMGQIIAVQSPSPYVYYTTDGSEPTTNSPAVVMTNNVGYIHWFNSTKDLTALRLKAFVGTNGSVTVTGQPVATNTIGTPPGFNPDPADKNIYAGIGSSIVVPIVCNLSSNSQIKSFQFRYEIAPLNNTNTPVILPLSVTTNDFVPVTTAAQSGVSGAYSITPYSLGPTNGLEVFAYSNVFVQHFAVVEMIEVQIPPNANVGDQYALNVLYPSATSDGYNQNVPLHSMAPAIITVRNIPYTVGDSASANGTWYNAGGFGDGNLDNADVMQDFFAASGLRVPYSFSDVFNAMDVYPVDTAGGPGGDGQIRFLDWNTILARSLRLDNNNWSREWSAGGNLVAFSTNLVAPQGLWNVSPALTPPSWPWYRQALVGGVSVGNVAPGATVQVPVYVKLQYGSTLAGLQFRAVVTPQNGAPALNAAPQFNAAAGVPSPALQQSFKPGETAFGWPLVPAPAFNYGSDSSNFLGWISFTIPAAAQSGQVYRVSFANVDGAPDLNTQYDLESRSAYVTVNGPAIPASVCSDEWKIHFFGSLTNPLAADNANPTGNGVPNWMAYLAGTDPTVAASRLQFSSLGKQITASGPQINLHWQTAPGKAYAVQWSTNLTTGPWNILTTVLGDGNEALCVDTNAVGPVRYYRLSLLP